jgi:hypothetical protein
MTIHYLPTEAHMHTNEWPARRCAGPCDQGRKLCVTPQACEVPSDDEVSPLIGILIGSTLGALILIGAVSLWRALA